jgi:putative addiction module killer protein
MASGNLGDVAPIGGGLSEARPHYGPGYRIYFLQRSRSRRAFLLTT